MSRRRGTPVRAVITGAAKGLGREFAIQLADRGGKLLLADIDVEGANQTAEMLRALDADARVISCDVRESDELVAAAREAREWMGDVDLLINNAGILGTGDIASGSLEDLRRVLDINLWGVVSGCHAFVPVMERGSRIINVASLAGAIPLPHAGVYSASKAAVILFSETLGAELSGRGISVTTLCPSFTRTEIINAASGDGHIRAMRLARKVMDKLGASPERVVSIALSASEKRDLYAIPTLHARLAWRAKRLAPAMVTRGMALAHRLLAPPRSRGG